MVEKEKEQSNPENPTGEGRSSSRTRSRASSVPLSHRPAADEESCKQRPVGVEEVFDILPIYGHLQPGEQQQVVFSFYGHENVSREVVARCHVEDGPTYEVKLRGEASVISYSLDSTHIDFGLQLFDHKGEADVTLRNTGRMGFTFNIIYPKREDGEAGEEAGQKKALVEEQTENGQEVRPGQPMVTPTEGYVDAGVEQCLHVLYLPGVPELFEKRLQLQVAFLPPQDIRLTGEGVFPRITLNLPRNMSDECYRDVVQQAGAAVEADRVKEELLTAGGGAPTEANCTPTYEELLHMEIERALVKQNALAVTGSLQERRDSQGSSRKWHKLSQFPLPEYVLDFGYVILGQVLSHTVNVTNTGAVAVSFQLNEKPLAGSEFLKVSSSKDSAQTDVQKSEKPPCGETRDLGQSNDPQDPT
ncbi:hydrocephalus-inducing protein-like [Notothenia coriiceps]|uniref:Hydrocephalus-inducing protein-like n=1 Tax=Notothenia coriiceps TaxID=8208 RepID=A0A6I9NMQ9_9TELE|nr:PREDICTED: hydrocephalus-inducing protein-like [Notothenia coriiceps]